MRIVIDTNVVISALFFGGYPRKVIESIIDGKNQACVSPEILSEYENVVQRMIDKKHGHLNNQKAYFQ